MIHRGALMSRPFKGVIVPLESFIQPVHASIVAQTHRLFEHRRMTPRNLATSIEAVEFYLIKKLLQDQFLLDVRPRHGRYVADPAVLNQYLGGLRESVPDYEIIFSKCFHDLKMRMWYFPDVVYLEQLGDSVIVTWKRE
jgi:hypothetical protein